MKKYLYTFLIVILSSHSFSQTNGAIFNLHDDLKEVGLISYLTLIQHYAPQAVIYANTKIENEYARNEANKNYMHLTIAYNSLINQISGDMNLKNSAFRYKKLDDYLLTNKKHDKIKKYYKLMKMINSYFRLLYDLNDGSSKLAIIGPDQALTFIGGVPYTIYKDFKATNTAKVVAISTLLKELRLKPLNEILPKTKDADQKRFVAVFKAKYKQSSMQQFSSITWEQKDENVDKNFVRSLIIKSTAKHFFYALNNGKSLIDQSEISIDIMSINRFYE